MAKVLIVEDDEVIGHGVAAHRGDGIGMPILVISAGADDYLVKPFSMQVLVARVRAAARRGARPQEETRGAALEIDRCGERRRSAAPAEYN